jgi:mxaA protein
MMAALRLLGAALQRIVALVLVAVTGLPATAADAPAKDSAPLVQSVAVVEPRAFGYFLGDVLTREVVLTLKRGARVEPASLPRPGPLNYWLDLRSVDVAEDDTASATQVKVTLAYQAFYSALDPRRLEIPGFTLKVSDGKRTADTQVPAIGFVISPLRELFAAKDGETPPPLTLRPDATPRLVATGPERTVMLIAAGVAVASLVLLAAHHAWGPFRRRSGRPFTEAARFLKVNARRLAGEGGYRAALIKLHRAFDRAAGRRLLPDDLEEFFKEHPEFAPLAPDVQRLFACSRDAFFANDVARARAAMPLGAIAELGSRLGAAERSAP